MTTTKTIYGREVEVKAGSQIRIDGWGLCHKILTACEVPELAAFRVQSNGGNLAVNVTIVGRTLQRVPYEGHAGYVRVKIEFVGDGEPSTFNHGWLLAK